MARFWQFQTDFGRLGSAGSRSGHGFPGLRPVRTAPTSRRFGPVWLLLLVLAGGGCKAAQLQPSNDRDWTPEQAILPKAEIRGSQALIHHVRNCKHLGDGEFVLDYYDKNYDLTKLQTVDYIVVPFSDTPVLAHTMLSFGFEGEEYLALSIEIRKEKGESYNPLYGALRQYELMYVLADERDVIRLRTDVYKDNVYLYRVKTTPEKARALLVDVLERANRLTRHPEFYDTLTNNCTNNIVEHVNKLKPDTVPNSLDVMLPGLSDRLAYDLGLLDTALPFEATRTAALVNDLAAQYGESQDFSTRIRTRTLASRQATGLVR